MIKRTSIAGLYISFLARWAAAAAVTSTQSITSIDLNTPASAGVFPSVLPCCPAAALSSVPSSAPSAAPSAAACNTPFSSLWTLDLSSPSSAPSAPFTPPPLPPLLSAPSPKCSAWPVVTGRSSPASSAFANPGFSFGRIGRIGATSGANGICDRGESSDANTVFPLPWGRHCRGDDTVFPLPSCSSPSSPLLGARAEEPPEESLSTWVPCSQRG